MITMIFIDHNDDACDCDHGYYVSVDNGSGRRFNNNSFVINNKRGS